MQIWHAVPWELLKIPVGFLFVVGSVPWYVSCMDGFLEPGQFGYNITDQFLVAILFTTKMKILLMMIFLTYTV